MTINAAMTMLIEELSEEIPDVLTVEFSLACLWVDLCRIATEPVPRDVAAVLDRPLDYVPVAVPGFDRSNFVPVYAD